MSCIQVGNEEITSLWTDQENSRFWSCYEQYYSINIVDKVITTKSINTFCLLLVIHKELFPNNKKILSVTVKEML